VKLLVVGGGRMGTALSRTARCKWAGPEEIAVVDLVEDRRTALSDAHPGLVVLDARERDPRS